VKPVPILGHKPPEARAGVPRLLMVNKPRYIMGIYKQGINGGKAMENYKFILKDLFDVYKMELEYNFQDLAYYIEKGDKLPINQFIAYLTLNISDSNELLQPFIDNILQEN